MLPRALVPLVKVSEGLARLARGLVFPYLCPANYATQGFGLRVADMAVPPITPAEAERRLAAVLPVYVAHTVRLCPILAMPEHEDKLAAVADFTYNLGPAALAGSTLRKKINRGDWPGARRELAKWVHGGGRVLPGLVIRRAREAALFPAQR
jgi:lysozyme